LSADNDQGAAYGYESNSAQIELDSLLRLGEQIYLQVTNGPDLGHLFSGGPRRRILGAGAIVPVGDDGLTFNAEYTRADTHPSSAPGTLVVSGLYERPRVSRRLSTHRDAATAAGRDRKLRTHLGN